MAKKLQFVGKFSTDDSIPAPSTASIGQTIVVKAVDENGKPTEWESVDYLKFRDRIESARKDGGIGYIEDARVIEFKKSDTFLSGEEFWRRLGVSVEYPEVYDYVFYKVSDTAIDPEYVSGYSIVRYGDVDSGISKMFSYAKSENIAGVICAGDNNEIKGTFIHILITSEDSEFGEGTWFLYADDDNYIKSLTMSEAIYPISDTFLNNLPTRVAMLESGWIIPKMEMPFEDYGEGQRVLILSHPLLAEVIHDGSELSVHLDGVDYNVTVYVAGNEYYVFGNMSYIGGTDDTGEPFIVVISPEGLYMMIESTEELHTIGIGYAKETIDPSQLPGVCLPVVELETEIKSTTNGNNTLLSEDTEILNKAMANRMPIIVTFNATGTTYTLVFNPIYEEGFFGYFAYTGEKSGVGICMNDEGIWYFEPTRW